MLQLRWPQEFSSFCWHCLKLGIFFLSKKKKKAANEIQELCCSKFQGITVPEYADRESYHLICSSDLYYLFNVTKDFLNGHHAITTVSLIVGFCRILLSMHRVQLFAFGPPRHSQERRREAH